MANHKLRQAIVGAAQAMNRLGLNQGMSGNVSARSTDAAMLITPTATPCERLSPKRIVSVSLADGAFAGPTSPSSEWRFHRDIYLARQDVGAVVHAHASHSTAFSMLRRDIPATHYMMAAFGGPNVRCTGYAPYGTQELSDLVIAGLHERNGVLLGNHGMIVVGHDLDETLWRAVELETLAKQTWLAMAIGTPVVLPDEEILRTVERFKNYGAPASKASARRKN